MQPTGKCLLLARATHHPVLAGLLGALMGAIMQSASMVALILTGMVATGMLARRRYSERPPRYEYLLTPKGRDFFPVVVALFAWGNKHLAPKGEALTLADRQDARPLDPVLVDAARLTPITPANTVLVPGPRASHGMRKRLASLKAMNPRVSPVAG